jgi:hypothetical protein
VPVRPVEWTGQGCQTAPADRARDWAIGLTWRRKARNGKIAHSSKVVSVCATFSATAVSVGWRDGNERPDSVIAVVLAVSLSLQPVANAAHGGGDGRSGPMKLVTEAREMRFEP